MQKSIDRSISLDPSSWVGVAAAVLAVMFCASWLARLFVGSSLASPTPGGACLLVSVTAIATSASRPGVTDRVPPHPRWYRRAQEGLRSIRWMPWAVLFGATMAGLAAFAGWRPGPGWQAPEGLAIHRSIVSAGVGLTCAFFTLLAQRWFASRHGCPRDQAIAHMLRLPLFGFVVAAAVDGVYAYAQITLQWPLQAGSLLVMAVAVELGIRAMLVWFTPSGQPPERQCLDSAIVRALRWHRTPIATAREALRVRYGVDLRRNWALASALRLLPVSVAMLAIAGWLLTGVTILALDQRGVYEQFGEPVAVWQSGLHVGLPWPFGKVQVVDNGAIREIVVTGGEAGGSASQAARSSADRLWDVAHDGETTQVVAGADGMNQSFQAVSADVRLIYRTALSDQAARDSVYRAVDVAYELNAIASRALVHYLATHTLSSLLEARQTDAQDALRHSIQQRMDALRSGVELTAVVIQAIHPPAGAAAAYHAVQAAQTRAQAGIAQARGFAAESLGMAREESATLVSTATAAAAETQAAAEVQRIDFSADAEAFHADETGGAAFTFEYTMHSLTRGLQNARLTVIDHRIAGHQRSVIDLRSAASSGDTGVGRGY